VERVGHPDRPLRIRADAVGTDLEPFDGVAHIIGLRCLAELRPYPSVAQPTVLADVKGGDPPGERLGDEEHTAGQDHHAVGEPQVLGHRGDGPVRIDPGERGVAQRRAAHEVEPEVAYEGASGLVDDHVIGHAGHSSGQISMLTQLTGIVTHQDAVIAHRDDECASVGKEPQAGRLAGNLGDDLGTAATVGRHDLIGVEVRDPQAPVSPSWALQVGVPVQYDRQLANH
jgi:hypothetical protein